MENSHETMSQRKGQKTTEPQASTWKMNYICFLRNEVKLNHIW